MAMEWAETAGDLLEDFPEDPFTFPTTCPESFFDASLDAMDAFGKDLFFCPPTAASDLQFDAPSTAQHMGAIESLDLESFLHSAMGEESILSDIPSSASSVAGDISAATDTSFASVSSFLTDYNGSASDSCPASVGDQCDVKTVHTFEVPGVVIIKKEKVEEEEEGRDINRSLQAVEFDIAKLKKEVDFSYDEENSLWSDFFSEEDPSEISREYDDLLQCLLSTPVNDIDLSLNVFNNVDTELEEQQQGAVAGAQKGAVVVIKLDDDDDEEEEQQSILSSIQADHCYTLRQPAPSSLLTPPPSSDESDRDDESSQDSSCQDVKPTLLVGAKYSVSRSSSSNLQRRQHQPDFSTKIVKFKQQPSDLKFVFSVKLKDGSAETVAPAGRSLLKKNASKAFSSSSSTFTSSSRQQLLRHRQFQSATTTTTLGRLSGDRRPAGKKHRSGGLALSDSGDCGEFGETVCAVRTLIQAEAAALGKFVPDFKNRKVQIDREIHNSMERQRRIELKREFDCLKSLIPEVATNEKVSKLSLLNVAARYVARLETTQTKLRWRKDLLKEKKKQLLQRLNILHISG